jgi:hypothetical protein
MANQFPESSKNNRKQAILNGDKTYNGVPCKNCGSTLKHVSSYSCVDCNVKRSLPKLYDDSLMAQYRTKDKRKKYINDNKDKRELIKRKSSLKEYGITIEDYDRMFSEQNGKCHICNGVSKRKYLSVDHCHTSNKVRGLLCESCNVGLGMFNDNVAFLKNAIEYLEKK